MTTNSGSRLAHSTPPGGCRRRGSASLMKFGSPSFAQHADLAAPAVTVADPATGTGSFLLGILRKIRSTVGADEGEGSVKGTINAAVKRVTGFEMQRGPFAFAQLRLVAKIVELTHFPNSY